MKWMLVKNFPCRFCKDVVAFRGRFYASVIIRNIVVIDPYSLEVTPLMHLQPLPSQKSLIPCGNDELFLVEKMLAHTGGVSKFRRIISRVSRLDEEAGKWVVVSDLGGRVLFINHRHLGNVSCSANELPDGCGVSGNSILFNFRLGDGSFFFKYGVHTGFDEDNLSFWRLSRENPVTILSKSPVLALRVKL
uniref:F-box/kelch-repeat protein n=1 Tax=Noccaea caerulescens TaxID=107243 RepID=A0A1J3IFB1_NOCCA